MQSWCSPCMPADQSALPSIPFLEGRKAHSWKSVPAPQPVPSAAHPLPSASLVQVACEICRFKNELGNYTFPGDRKRYVEVSALRAAHATPWRHTRVQLHVSLFAILPPVQGCEQVHGRHYCLPFCPTLKSLPPPSPAILPLAVHHAGRLCAEVRRRPLQPPPRQVRVSTEPPHPTKVTGCALMRGLIRPGGCSPTQHSGSCQSCACMQHTLTLYSAGRQPPAASAGLCTASHGAAPSLTLLLGTPCIHHQIAS